MQERFRWSAVAAHIGAADTLRRRLAASWVGQAPVDLDPRSGTPPPGPGEGLREALRGLDAQGGDDDPQVLVTLWQGIAEGRWSIVDHFEAGDRRYLAAYRHPALIADPRALSEREHDVAVFVGAGANNRQVAADLGMSPSTVATHLAAALSKLGLAKRLDLVALVGRFAHAVPPEHADDGHRSDPAAPSMRATDRTRSPRGGRA